MLKDNILIINLFIIINIYFNFLTFKLFFKIYIKKILRIIIKKLFIIDYKNLIFF